MTINSNRHGETPLVWRRMKVFAGKVTLLYVSAFFAMITIGVIGSLMVEDTLRRVFVVILMLIMASTFTSPVDDLFKGHNQLRFLLQTLIIVILLALTPDFYIFHMLFFVISPSVMMSPPAKRGLLWIALFALISGIYFVWGFGWREGLLILIPFSSGYLFFGAFGNALTRAEEAQERSEQLLAELRQAHSQLQDYAVQVENLAVVEERNRLAREMHDTIGHRLTVASVQLEGAQRLIPREPERAAAMVSTVREQVREALSELRRSVATLREPVETGLSLTAAVQRLIQSFQEATGVQVYADLVDGLPKLDDARHMALYRAAQEGLTNIQRHSRAQNAWLRLESRDGWVRLLIADDGVGYPTGETNQGFGLMGLQERAAQLGGDLRLESRLEGGAQLVFTVPVPVTEDAHD